MPLPIQSNLDQIKQFITDMRGTPTEEEEKANMCLPEKDMCLVSDYFSTEELPTHIISTVRSSEKYRAFLTGRKLDVNEIKCIIKAEAQIDSGEISNSSGLKQANECLKPAKPTK